jgi:cell division transport system ATP-binding protein
MDDPKPAGTIISLKDVEVFQDSNLILSQVNLNIDKGEFVFLVGKREAANPVSCAHYMPMFPLRVEVRKSAGITS